jgi:hypothetical protein
MSAVLHRRASAPRPVRGPGARPRHGAIAGPLGMAGRTGR